MELNQALERVRKLITLASHPGTGKEEADTAQAMADALMLKFAIDEIILDNALPIEERQKPETIEVQLSSEADMMYQMYDLADRLARHCRCLIRSRYDRTAHCWMAKVYGFQSDVRYFEFMYTTIRLHMIGALRPKVDPAETLEENCYRFHQAGYNWLEIAEFYGWKKIDKYSAMFDHADIQIPYRNKDTDEVLSASKVGSSIKRAYYRACAQRGESPTQISAGGSKTYRKDAASGYTDRLGQRLRKSQQSQGPGTAIVLVSRMDILEELFRQDNPSMYTLCPECNKLGTNPYDCEFCKHHIKDEPPLVECERCKIAGKEYAEGKRKSPYCRDHSLRSYKPRPRSEAGYQAGVRHADSAPLSPEASTKSTQAIH